MAAKKSWASLSPLESEGIGLVWAATSLHYYMHRCPSITCILDHHPLKTLMEALMETLSPRMFRAHSMLLQYIINFEWSPGQRMTDPLESLQEDAPLQHSISNITGLEPFIGVEVSDSIKAAIRVDTSYQEILKVVGTVTRKYISHLPVGHLAKELASIWGLVSKADWRGQGLGGSHPD